MKTIAVLSIAVALLVAAAAAHADVIITTFATSSGCVGTSPDIVRVPELSCRVEGTTSAKYESNNTHVESKTYSSVDCSGVPTIKDYQLDVCYQLTSSSSVKYGNSETPAPGSAGFVSTALVAIVMVFVTGAMIFA